MDRMIYVSYKIKKDMENIVKLLLITLFVFMIGCQKEEKSQNNNIVPQTSKKQINLNSKWFGMKASEVFGTNTEAYNFSLMSKEGPVKLSNFKNKIVLLYFGYTHCPDICPTVMHTLAKTVNLLGNNAKIVKVVMISIDPKRDTPTLMAKYVKFYNKDFIGLSGTPSQIKDIAVHYKAFYRKETNPKNPKSYYMEHSDFVYLIYDGKIKLIYTEPRQKARWIAEDIEHLLGKKLE